MIKVMTNMGEGVIGISVEGEVTGADYKKVVIPVILAEIERNERIRLLVHAGPKLKNFTAGAMAHDASLGMQTWNGYEKIAFVTEEGWLMKSVDMFKFMMPAEVRTFKNSQLSQAKEWIKKPVEKSKVEPKKESQQADK